MKTKYLLAAVAGLVLLIVGVAGGMLGTRIFGRDGSALTRNASPATHAVYFVALDPIVVSVPGAATGGLLSSGRTYLQISFQFQSSNAKAVAAFKAVAPAIRGRVMQLMLTLPSAVLNSPAARDQMKRTVLADVNAVLRADNRSLGAQPFSRVYITDFVTQPG